MITRKCWFAVSAMAVMVASFAQAVDGTWTNNANGSWSVTDNWLNGIAADGAGSTATLGNYIDADRTITLDSNRTNGNIAASDTTHNYTISGANILTLDRTDATKPTINVTTSGRTLTISSQISGNDGLQKTGAGTLSLSGDNDYTGDTVINAGIVIISHANALGSTAGNTTIAAGSGKLQLSYPVGSTAGPVVNSPENITITGSGDAINNPSKASCTLSGDITLDNPTGTITFSTNNGGSRIFFSGTITQLGTSRDLTLDTQSSGGQGITVNNPIANNGGRLVIGGSGTKSAVILKGVNATDGTGIGQTLINTSANLTLGNSDVLNTTATLTVDGAFILANYNQTINALNGSTSGTVQNSVAGTKTLTVGNGGGTGTFYGVIQTGAGQVALIKTGAGSQTLTGVNTYSGTTLINGGTLVGRVGGSCASSAVTVTNATLAIGVVNDTNQWTCASLTLNNGSKLAFNFSGTPSPTNAPLKILGNITFNGTSTIELVSATPGTYPLLTITGTPPGTKPTLTGVGGALKWIDKMLWVVPSGTVIYFR